MTDEEVYFMYAYIKRQEELESNAFIKELGFLLGVNINLNEPPKLANTVRVKRDYTTVPLAMAISMGSSNPKALFDLIEKEKASNGKASDKYNLNSLSREELIRRANLDGNKERIASGSGK